MTLKTLFCEHACGALAWFLALGLLWPAATANADQSDPRLDIYFVDLVHAQDPRQAQAILNEINRVWIEHPDPKVAQLVQIGTQMIQAGAYRDATQVFEAVTTLAPNYAEGWNRLATVLYYRGLNSQALAPTRRTLELEPRHYGALWGLAMILSALGREGEAKMYFELTYAIAPSLPGALERANQRP